jgi:hypothetical protein
VDLKVIVRGAVWEDIRAAVPADVRERVILPDISVSGNTEELVVVATAEDLVGTTGECSVGIELDV